MTLSIASLHAFSFGLFPLNPASRVSRFGGTLSEEDVGLLVPLGFDITAFTPAAYQRGSLPRPSKMSHLEDGFALRCFQRLS